jgi:hypothetical protein
MTSPQLLFYDNIIARKLSFVNNFGNILFREMKMMILLFSAVHHLSIPERLNTATVFKTKRAN